jgi:hypothetical protein
MEMLEAHVETLKTHVEILRAQLGAAEARAEKRAAEFDAREARHAADFAVERALSDQMCARVDQLMADLAAERSRRAKVREEHAGSAWKSRTQAIWEWLGGGTRSRFGHIETSEPKEQ